MSFINTATFGSLNTSNVTTSSFTASTITAPIAAISSLVTSTFTVPVINTPVIGTSSFTASTITAPVIGTSSFTASTITAPVIGTSSFTASTITAPVIGTSSFTASTIAANGLTTVQQITEKFDILSSQTGAVNLDFASSAIWYHSSINGNITARFINVPQTQSRSAVVTLIFNQGASPFYANNISVNTSTVSIKWANATVPTPVANRVEAESLTLLNVGGIWTALGQYTSFG